MHAPMYVCVLAFAGACLYVCMYASRYAWAYICQLQNTCTSRRLITLYIWQLQPRWSGTTTVTTLNSRVGLAIPSHHVELEGRAIGIVAGFAELEVVVTTCLA